MIVIAPIFWIGNTHRRFLQKCQKTCSNLKLGDPRVRGCDLLPLTSYVRSCMRPMRRTMR